MAGAFSNFNFPLVSKLNPHYIIRPASASILSNTNPMAMTIQTQNHEFWASKEAQIEGHLKKVILVRPPLEVFEPMYNLVMAAPKTKAAALCIVACELIGGGDNNNDIVAAASAVQLVYAASCVHGQMPLTDRSSLIPKLGLISHHAYDPNIELLIGDAIMPFAFELLAQSVNPARNNSGQVLHVIVELSRIIGSLVDGQWKEIEITKSNGCDDAMIEHVLKKKESGLHACGAACGAILGGGSEEEVERLRKYGLYIDMIQGIVNNVGIKDANKEEFVKRVEELRVLAMDELKHFECKNVEPISSLVHAIFDGYLK